MTATLCCDDRNESPCEHCGETARLISCDECGREGWVLNCGHMAQPRPIAADGSHTVCTDCCDSMNATAELARAFCEYTLAEWCCEIDPANVTTTRDTMENFVEKWGQPDYENTYGNQRFAMWEHLQTRKGAREGDLFVSDLGEFRLTSFDGAG